MLLKIKKIFSKCSTKFSAGWREFLVDFFAMDEVEKLQ